MAPRIYLPPKHIIPPHISLPDDVAHYLRRVLRLNAGAEFVAFDGSGAEYRAALRLEGDEASGEIIERLPDRAPQRLHLTLYQGLPKGKKLPLIIQKATELGVARIVPVQTDRATVRLEDKDTEGRRQRWQKVADEAAEQSHRIAAPEIGPVMSWAEALADWRQSSQPGLMPDETLAGQPGHGLRETMERLSHPDSVSVFIGPEGGISPQEAAAGREAGLEPISLGPRILRTETAAIVVCALLLYEAGDLG